MNRKEAIEWAEANLTPNQLRNFKRALYEADSYMTQEAHDSYDYFAKLYRQCATADTVKALDDNYQSQRQEIEDKIKELQRSQTALFNTYQDSREKLVGELYKAKQETEEFKAAEKFRERVWVGIGAVREMKIEALVSKYQKRINAKA